MTPLMLQDDLVEEIRRMLNGYEYKVPNGESGQTMPIRVFAQSLPVNETDDDEDPVPYIIVRLASGEDSGAGDSFNTVKLLVIIGTWDDTLDSQGYREVMNIIQNIYHRFHKDPCLNNRAVYSGEFHWMMQEDGYFPYFFGACSMNFHIAAVRREDELA